MRSKASIYKKIIPLLFIIGQILFGFAQIKEYQIDIEESKILFKITHMGFLTVKGTFHSFSGKLVFDTEKLKSIECKIDVKSIDTKDKTRDESLIDKNYLSAQKYPYITFISTEISSKHPSLSGILKIKEVERKISMPFEFGQLKGKKALIKISTIINRKDFKLYFGPMDALIGNDIEVELKIVGINKF